MAFLLADSFQSSLDRLSGDEQKAAKLAAFELQINPAKQASSATGLTTSKTKTSGQPVPAATSA
jgi:ABC-type cobalamin transport system ATPase subunit